MKTSKVGKLLHVISSQCQLGEGVLWHVEQQAIYWIDIENAVLFRYDVTTESLEKYTLPYRIGCFSFTANDDVIIAAFAQGIARYNYKTSSLQWLSQPSLNNGNRFNDGKTDKNGRFWAGTLVEQKNYAEQQAHLYRLGQDLVLNEVEDNLTIANGLCWNNSGNKLFHADSPEHKIFQYDFCHRTGKISNKTLFAQTAEHSFPDGATVDSADHLWSAQWGSSNVVRYDKNGVVDLVLTLPVTQPSCVAIGGKNMDWLMVTSAKQDLSKNELAEQPLAGNLFIFQLHNITGVQEPICTI